MARHSHRHTSILADFSTSFIGLLIYNVFAYLVPAYKTFESFQSTDIEEEKLWLKYWLFMIFFIKAEELIRSLIHLPVQWYYIKLGLLSFFLLVNTELIGKAYNRFEKPYFEKYSGIICDFLKYHYRKLMNHRADMQKKLIDIAAANEEAINM
ncbi:TB2/DP1, HVA22 family protein [Trichomonas vaginalis G3]|uniref:TB2/DP1, HVA22 family protein n=1 Tax=Trichomonas vaginalis (strain ATCC PRA-98 / G3) TaxID=412133 RepID=A2DML5_TRIV3|nr:tautomerase/MIF superfamily [Trichomonas vaginalis G3]EAY18442.1 TB2/DP1, HVA22 family protein [Trichomonas vaginalis G3]KAI5530279.1 tautomerase/MIF superfamily [Trichomonas vaginalis G3]|eukprot:XP_001579428.1 TB2/DP1, HVA22 family protein [Trichomonas vaginalis G3]